MAEKSKNGAPPKYHEDFNHLAQVACEEGGFTDAKLAKLFKVTRRTITNWKNEYPEFKDAVKAGKDVFDSQVVEKAFLKRCTGFRYTETTREAGTVKTLDPATGEVIEEPAMVITKKVSKIVVPDAKGCMDWLTNRQPDRWKKSKHVEITGKDGGPVKTESLVAVPSGPMSIEQWEAEVKAARAHDKDIEPGQIPGNA